ncbi:MAG: DUF1573 domain-containing protein [Planctomycetota bacterium]|nr:DUF1573 domain-containing protein [Planctomycetota bacterium]
MKKLVPLGIVMLIGGIAIGICVAQFEISQYVPRFGDDEYAGADTIGDSQEDGPRVTMVTGSDFNFGVMERNGTRSHQFEIKNTGNAPLSLEKGETTCKCTMNKLVDGVLQPGESVKIELEWIAKEVGPDMVFVQTADIKTNDPSRKVLRLTIRGDIITTVKVVPSVLVLSSISGSEGAEGQVSVYSYRTDDLEFVETKVDPKLKEFIEAVIEPMSVEELSEDNRARSGKKIKIRLKPGLPVGLLDQTVWLKTNLEDSPLVPVYFQAKVVGDITIYGRNFNRVTNHLRLGKVVQADGLQAELRFLVRGEDRDAVKLTVASVDPPGSLEAKIRSSGQAVTGKASQHFLDITIPKGADVISRLGDNQEKPVRILINTTHPQFKTITITVAFEVTK